jgi:hypothetical protein
MSKNIIEIPDNEKMLGLKKLALENGLPINNQGMVDLAIRIANDVINHLEDEDFINIFNLKK